MVAEKGGQKMRKFNLSFMTKVTLMVVALILLTATTVGMTSITTARGLLVENKLRELGADVEISSIRLVAGIDALRNDTIFLSNLPEVDGVRRAIEAGGVDPVDLTTDALWRTQLIGVFSELLISKPHYVRLQYISTDEALELVRVENSDGAIRVLGRRELNIGVADDYFLAAQALAPGTVYLSDIGLQRDNDGALVDPQTIVMYASTPIYSDDGSVFGIIAIGLDFGVTFDELLSLKKDEEALYITNQSGDFLLNSADPSLTYGFETGQQYRIQDTFDALVPLFSPSNTLQELPASPDTNSNASAVHFRRVSFDELTPDRYLGVAVATPYSKVVGAVNSLLDQGVLITAVLMTGGIILAVFIMRRLIRPLYQITLATQQISEGRFNIHLPVHSNDEFGQLASGFNQMAEAVQDREQELIEVNQSLEGRVEERTLELRRARDEALAAQRIALEHSRLKSEFLSTMSHELRTPLNAIIGFSDMLLAEMSGPLNDKQQHKMARLKENGTRLLALINDLLDLTRIEAGRIEMVEKAFAPRALVERMAAQMESLAVESRLTFETIVHPDVPEILLGDEKRVEQVIVNLLSNAFKFTKEGSITLNMDANHADQSWVLSVTDTGIGIPPHAINIIFEEFRQLDGTYSRAYRGSGLGLAITRNLVRMMGGKISVKSEIGNGSTFTVVLPLIIPETVPSTNLEAVAI
jgi:signal transduction histidine kinase